MARAAWVVVMVGTTATMVAVGEVTEVAKAMAARGAAARAAVRAAVAKTAWGTVEGIEAAVWAAARVVVSKAGLLAAVVLAAG